MWGPSYPTVQNLTWPTLLVSLLSNSSVKSATDNTSSAHKLKRKEDVFSPLIPCLAHQHNLMMRGRMQN